MDTKFLFTGIICLGYLRREWLLSYEINEGLRFTAGGTSVEIIMDVGIYLDFT
jgi:hypothetical protein